MIRFGIVGIGGFAAVWMQCLDALEEKGVARVAAAVVRRPERYTEQVAALQSRGCSIYPSLDIMLEQAVGEIDIVGLPTGIAHHVPMAIQAMEVGYPVLVEKPLAATVQEVHMLQQAEERSGQWCAVGYQWLHSPTIRWLADRIQSGALGRIRRACSMIGWPRDDTYYARNAWAGRLRDEQGRWVLDGPATNATAHYLMNLLYLVGRQQDEPGRIASVQAELYRARNITGYDTSAIRITTEDGAQLLHLTSHTLAHSLDPVMTIVGDKGTARWQAQSDEATIDYENGQREHFANPAFDDNHARPIEQAAHVVAGREKGPLCTAQMAGAHVLAINLAFESAQGISPIPPEFVQQKIINDNSTVVCVDGMEQALQTAYDRGLLFAEAGLPWARAGRPIEARGYERFPGARLAAILDG